ncbi:major facilitator superfamily domain-containing protein, partial [Globomyces pollinis-pini]
MSFFKLFLSQTLASIAMLTAGSAYTFSLFGPQMSYFLDLTQSETAFIASCGNAGVFIGGPLFGSLVDRYPDLTWAFFLMGGSGIFTGYYVTSLTFDGSLPKPHYLILAFYFLLIGLGSAATYHCSLATNYRNWPEKYRSIAVGFSVGFFGLSAYFFATLGSIFFMTDNVLRVNDYLFFLGTFGFVLNLILFVFLKPYDQEEEFIDPECQRLCDSIQEQRYLLDDPQLMPIMSVDLDIEEPETRQQSKETACFPSWNSVLLGYNMFAVIGVGLMHINNLGAVVIAILPPELTAKDSFVQAIQKSHVQTFSIHSFVSGVVLSLISDFGATSFGIVRTVWPIVAAVLMTAGCMYTLYIQHIEQLDIVTILIGWGFGAMWTAIPILVGEYFGLRNFAKNWGWMTVIPAFGGQFFSSLFGQVYESAGTSICKGAKCYYDTFLISTILCGIAVFGNILLYIKRARDIRQ